MILKKVRGESRIKLDFFSWYCLILYYCRNWNTKKFWLACCSWFSHSSQPATSSSGWDLWWQSESFTCRGNYCNWIFLLMRPPSHFLKAGMIASSLLSNSNIILPVSVFSAWEFWCYSMRDFIVSWEQIAWQEQSYSKSLLFFLNTVGFFCVCAWHSSIQRWGVVSWGLSSKTLFLGSMIKLNSLMILS